MSQDDLLELERSIKDIPGVLGCVIVSGSGGDPAEIQAFTTVGTQRSEIEQAILGAVSRHGYGDTVHQVLVFELEAEGAGGREALSEAAAAVDRQATSEPGLTIPDELPIGPESTWSPAPRPLLNRVMLTTTSWRSQAEVSLGPEGGEVVGQATGEKTPHGLKVLAEATLEAVAQVVGDVTFELLGASLVTTFGREAVLVLVRVDGSVETLGAALVRETPVTEAAVRATLDAVNRRLATRL